MEESGVSSADKYEQEIDWTLSFLRNLQGFGDQKAARVKTIQLLIQQTSMVSVSRSEAAPSEPETV